MTHDAQSQPKEPPSMTPEWFAEKMRAIAKRGDGDPEANHAEMDDLMERVLRDLGYGEGLDAVANLTRWYA